VAKALWTDESLQHMAKIYKYIAEDSPKNAEEFLNGLMDSVETQLELSAEVGRITPEFKNPKKREII
jgi:plasmid stabilization system protein ParE